MHGAEKDAALPIDVRAVLVLQRRLKDERAADGDAPPESDLGGLAGVVLVHSKRSVDAGTVDLLALLVQAADRGAHALGGDEDDVDVLTELLAARLEVAEEEAVGEAEGGTLLEERLDLGLVIVGLGGVGDEQHDEVRLLDHIILSAEEAILLGEANSLSSLPRGRGLAEAHLNVDVRPDLLQGVLEVLALSGSLGAPANDTDLLHALKGLGHKRELVPASPKDVLLGRIRSDGELKGLLLEDTGLKHHRTGGLAKRGARGRSAHTLADGGRREGALQHRLERRRADEQRAQAHSTHHGDTGR
mmetsp:Transcript_8261/g.19256  ORF Transcript_8261/g.19256 Transcript_8261/m.19256 type:complete len:303 (-) Transcript_8261:45-953(-)